MKKLRFELSGRDVGSLLVILDNIETDIEQLRDAGAFWKHLLTSYTRMFVKVRMYGAEAFDTRDDYRNWVSEKKDYIKKMNGLTEE